MRRAALIAVALVDAVLALRLAGSVPAALMFAAFVAFILLPAIVLVLRIPRLTVITASLLVSLLAVPWFFLRKAVGMPLLFDAATAVTLTTAAWLLRPRALSIRWLPGFLPIALALPILFSLVWLGWNAPVGEQVRQYGLFAIDFGNLVSVAATLRASPMLPQSFVAGGGAFSYHWLYFTLPAALADFGGGSMPMANALLLTNLLAALLLVHTVCSVADDSRAAAIVLFAPFTTYFYQAAATRLHLGILALPTRNHLLLSPINSMLVFGNNSIALVLALVTVTELERWNREGHVADAVIGCLALALLPGYSITLLFPLTLTLVVWTLLGRVRRPLLVVPLAAVTGAAMIALFLALGIIARGGSRHIALGFDHGQFLRMLIFGTVPLWGIAVLTARRGLRIQHVLVAACLAVPSLLYISGGPTGGSDFSMKTASLYAVAFAPLLAIPLLTGWRAAAAGLLVLLGLVQTSAYVLQFPWYRLRRATNNGVGIPRDYVAALEWVRDHTPPSSLVVDPQGLANRDELFTLSLAERRVWLPTAYTNEVLLVLPPDLGGRLPLWQAFERGDAAAGEAIAREADYLVAPFATASPEWRAVHREGRWTVYESLPRRSLSASAASFPALRQPMARATAP